MCIEQKLMLGAHRAHPLNERFWCAERYVKSFVMIPRCTAMHGIFIDQETCLAFF